MHLSDFPVLFKAYSIFNDFFKKALEIQVLFKPVQSLFLQNFNILACLCSRASSFESYLVRSPDDRFSPNEAHIPLTPHDLSTSNSTVKAQKFRKQNMTILQSQTRLP